MKAEEAKKRESVKKEKELKREKRSHDFDYSSRTEEEKKIKIWKEMAEENRKNGKIGGGGLVASWKEWQGISKNHEESHGTSNKKIRQKERKRR